MAENIKKEEITVSELSSDGKVKTWSCVETVEANTGEERKLSTLTINTKTSGVRRDSCQAATVVVKDNGEIWTRKIMESARYYHVKKRYALVTIENPASDSPPPPPPPPPTPKESSKRRDSETDSSDDYPDNSTTVTHASEQSAAMLATTPESESSQMGEVVRILSEKKKQRMDEQLKKLDVGADRSSEAVSKQRDEPINRVGLEGKEMSKSDNIMINM